MHKVCLTVALLLAGFIAQAQVPEWIWSAATPHNNETVFFRKTFEAHFKPERAEISCTADDELTLFLNGKQIAESPDWRHPVTVDVGGQIRLGENVLAVRAKNHESAAGLLVKLEMRSANGSPRFVFSDGTWLCSTNTNAGWEQTAFKSAGWASVASLGKLGMEPWGEALGKPSATPVESLTLLPGFKAELLKSADHSEGSWVCMTIDDKGRFIVSPEKTEFPFLRITLAKNGSVAKTEHIAEPMRGAMGLCYALGSLYVNGRGPKGVGLYRLTDKNHDDQFETNEMVLLKNFDGDNEHGYHAVVLGPDKHIYVMNGNHTKVPDGIAPESPHVNYQEDCLLPQQWDPNGHAKGIFAPGGYVLRTDAEGKRWELICGGFRNTYDFDFNPEGEMFTFDSDMEWDVGAPWYRPTRINHIVSGGEYGWRSGSAKWPVYYHDSLPSNLDIGLSSPTGVKFGAKSKFPSRYRDAFYVSDWAYGKIFAVHLRPVGASYAGTFETFVRGKPLNVVDLEFGKDGAMYFILGGWKTQSGLYRVSYVGGDVEVAKAAQISPCAQRIGAEQRSIRHQLEVFHGKKDRKAIEIAWPYLDSSDRWLRYAARVAVESQDVSAWQERALTETRTEASLTALLALSRCGGEQLQPRIISRLEALLASELTEEQRLECLRTFEVCFTRMGRPSDADHIATTLSRFYPATSENINRELCQLLVYLGDPNVLEKTLNLLGHAPTQQEQMYYAFVLRNVTNGWTFEQRQTYFAWFNKALVEYKGGNSFEKYLNNTRNEAAEKLSPAERTEFASIIDPKPQSPAVALPKRQFVREWKLGDFASDLASVGKGRSFAKGREAFAAAQCILCHRVGTDGGSVGPDLTGVSGRFNRHDLLDNILSPSKIISDRYQSFTIVKKNEEEFSGYVVEETADKVVIMFDPLNGTTAEVKKSDIQTRSISKLSPMPEGLLNVLTKEEILDLIAYIESDGKATGAAFVATR